ncbi:MAG: hypothetical protein ACLGHL_08715, partial [Actinomycetota bacterium]
MRRRKRVGALTEPGWDLYGLSLKEFTAARNDLAKRLRAEGDTEGAKRVKALKKPKLSAWAVNQLVRRYPQDVGALIAMTESVGTATDPHRMREASAQRQGAIAQLVDRAEELLVDEGHATGATTRQEIVQTLQATSEDGARSEALAGMLTEPLAPTGFFGVPTSDIDNEPPALSAEIQELQRRIARLEE